MNRLDIAWTGAKGQSFVETNPRAMLFRLASENPDSSDQELLDLCLAEIETYPEYIEGIVEYWFMNNYRVLRRSSPRRDPPPRTIIDNIKAQIRLLDWVMPNGKTLGQSTGTECIKAGGWLTDIGKKAGKQIVATVFSEQELSDMLAEHA